MRYDTTNSQRINQLHPTVAALAYRWLAQCQAEGLEVLVTQGLRTIAEQDRLYAQGRTTPGNIVTNARGGQSYHNFGLALDYCMTHSDGSADWQVGPKWRRIAAIAKSLGFEWGGDWTDFIDYPHLQYTFGLSIRDLQNGSQPPAAPTPEEKEEAEMPKLDKAIANNIIDGYLSPAWIKHNEAYQKALAAGDKEGAEKALELREWQRTLANALRDQAGIPRP